MSVLGNLQIAGAWQKQFGQNEFMFRAGPTLAQDAEGTGFGAATGAKRHFEQFAQAGRVRLRKPQVTSH
jgi:hypothetical protein